MILSSQDMSGLNIVKLFPILPQHIDIARKYNEQWKDKVGTWTSRNVKTSSSWKYFQEWGEQFPWNHVFVFGESFFETHFCLITLKLAAAGTNSSVDSHCLYCVPVCTLNFMDTFVQFLSRRAIIGQNTLFTRHTTMEWTVKVVMCIQGKIWEQQGKYYQLRQELFTPGQQNMI